MVLVVFLLTNRTVVQIGFWPFVGGVSLPIGAVALAALLLGVLLGMLLHLPHRLAAGRRAKRAEKRVAELEAKLTSPGPTISGPTP
ncbi:MAG TPA: lipopolysaccharide assembly protein LapA domain-containing protein [Acidocella sp.]|nr:lipopolysaccharide assembly protein LapA domain-containing protein [Acidocella sp.]